MKGKALFGVILFTLGMMTACTTTRQTISPTNFLSNVHGVSESIESMGYKQSGTSSDQRNEVYVAATSYSTTTGFGSAMGNDYYWYDTYRFTDSTNNTASYQIKYKCAKDNKGKLFVSNVCLAGCDCSNPYDYNKICGHKGVTERINNIKSDQVSTFDDDNATIILTCSLILVGCCIPFLFLL